MILRIVSASTLKVIEVDDVSQVVVLASSGEPVACAHEASSGAIIATNAGDDDFETTLQGLGVKPARLDIMRK